jgi:hypothetical protein
MIRRIWATETRTGTGEIPARLEARNEGEERVGSLTATVAGRQKEGPTQNDTIPDAGWEKRVNVSHGRLSTDRRSIRPEGERCRGLQGEPGSACICKGRNDHCSASLSTRKGPVPERMTSGAASDPGSRRSAAPRIQKGNWGLGDCGEPDIPHSQSLGRAKKRVYAPIEIM